MTTPATKTADTVLQLEYELTEIAVEEMGMHEQEAFGLARAIVRGLSKRYGGLRMGVKGEIYIPSPSRAERDEAIRREFTGRNIPELMRRHGVSRAQIYRIVRPHK